jgi:hypothetical protein
MATWKLPPQVSTWIDQLSQPLHGRLAWRLVPLLTGILFAPGQTHFKRWIDQGVASNSEYPNRPFSA